MVYKDHSIYSNVYLYKEKQKEHHQLPHPTTAQTVRKRWGGGGKDRDKVSVREGERKWEDFWHFSWHKNFNTIKLVNKMITLAKPKYYPWTFSVKVQFPTHVVHLNTVPLFLLFFFFFCYYKDSQRYHDQQTTLKSNRDKTLAILYHN